MQDRVKGIIPLILIAFAIFLSVDIKNTGSIGDWLLDSIGLKAWTGGTTGTHLTVFYSLALVIIIILFVGKRMKVQYDLLFAIGVVIASLFAMGHVANSVADYLKAKEDGIYAIGFDSHESSMNYSTSGNGLVEFDAEIELTNYSDQALDFNLGIIRRRGESLTPIEILDFSGNQAVFHLEAKEAVVLRIDDDHYKIDGLFSKMPGGGSINGGLSVVITDIEGESMLLARDDFWGQAIDLEALEKAVEYVEIYTLVMKAIMYEEPVLNQDMAYIAVDFDSLIGVSEDDYIYVYKALGIYDVEIINESLMSLDREGKTMDNQYIEGILLRVDDVSVLSKDEVNVEVSKFKSRKGTIGIEYRLVRKDGRWVIDEVVHQWAS